MHYNASVPSEDFEIFYHHLTFTKMKKDYFSKLDDYGEPFFAWVSFVSLLKFKSFDQFNPPELHQILDIY